MDIYSEPRNEGSSLVLDLTFRDRTGVPVIPVRAFYAVFDNAGATLHPMTDLATVFDELAAHLTLILPSELTLIPEGRASLTLQITLVFQYGDANQRGSQKVIVPINPIPGVPVPG